MVFQRHPNFLVSNKMMKVREEEITMGNLTLDIFMCIQLEKESAANGHKKIDFSHINMYVDLKNVMNYIAVKY